MKKLFKSSSLIKAIAIISSNTLISRILGFVRDFLMAFFFGTTMIADTFVVAFRIPNLLRRMFAEGALVPGFIPIFTEIKNNKSPDDMNRYFSAVFNLIVIILSIIVIVGIIFSKYIVILIAPGFSYIPYKFNLTILLTKIMFPYIIFISTASILMGVLNSFKHFFSSSIAPVLFNITLILTFGIIYLYRMELNIENKIIILSFGVLIGGLTQLLIQIPALLKYKIKWLPKLFDPQIKKTLFLLFPAMVGAAVFQINVFIDTIISSLSIVQPAQGGAPTILYFANRLLQFPLGLFGIATATAVFPYIANALSKNDVDTAKEYLLKGIKLAFMIVIPAGIGLMILGKSIIKLLFEHGKFTVFSTAATYQALFFYSIGLFAFTGQKIIVHYYYSMKDMKTPLKIGFISIIINLILNLVLMYPMKYKGIALATAISATYNFIHLHYILNKRISGLFERTFIIEIIKVVCGSLVMGIIVFTIYRYLSIYNFHLILKIFIPIVIGILSYFGVLKLIKFKLINQLLLDE